jgi:threonine dehydratase
MMELAEFRTALSRIRPHLTATEQTLDAHSGLWLKWESHHPTHSFKPRGAFNKLLAIPEAERPPFFVTGSAGNHGQAVSLAARELGLQAKVFVPEATPHVKVDRMRSLGADVERVPGFFGIAEAKAIRTAAETGVPFISPYNDRDVIAGAGTIALEWLTQNPELERLLVPVGGGGLVCGVGFCAKQINPDIEIIGILSEASPYLYHQYYYGHMDDVVERATLTDGLAGDVEPGSLTIDWISSACDAIVQVSEAAIAQAVVDIYRQLGEVVEGSAAVGHAAVLQGSVDATQKRTGSIMSGGNIDPDKLENLLSDHPAES